MNLDEHLKDKDEAEKVRKILNEEDWMETIKSVSLHLERTVTF